MANETAIAIFVFALIYLVLASGIIALISDDESNLLNIDANKIYQTSSDLTIDNSSDLYTFESNNAQPLHNANGLGIDIIDETKEGYVLYIFDSNFHSQFLQENKGWYNYTITKTGNEEIIFYYEPQFDLDYHRFKILDNNFYFETPNYFKSDLLVADIGNTFSYTLEYDENSNIYRCYLNNKVVKIIDNINLFDSYDSVINEVLIKDESVFITNIDTNSEKIKNDSDWLSSLSDMIGLILEVMTFGIPEAPWFIDLIFIRLWEFILLVSFIRLLIP